MGSDSALRITTPGEHLLSDNRYEVLWLTVPLQPMQRIVAGRVSYANDDSIRVLALY